MTDLPVSPAREASPPATPPLELRPEPRAEPDPTPRGLVPVLVALLLVTVAWIVGPTIATMGEPGPDEFYYLSFGKTLVERGPGAIREIVRTYVAEPRHWQYPNPLRVGYLAVAALWMKADGVAPQSLAHLSLVAHLLAIVVVFRLAGRRLGPARALFAATLFGCAPLLLGLARRALQDSVATLAALLAIAAFLAALERPARRRFAALAVALAFAFLTKESLALLALPMATWIVLELRTGHLERRRALEAMLALAAAGGIALATWTVAAGDFGSVRRLIEIVLASPATNAYALRYGGGPWWRYLVDFVALSPVPTLLAVAGAALALDRARRGEAERFHLFLVLFAALTLGEFAFLTKNVRYVMPLELPIAVLAVEAIWRLVPVRAAAARVAAAAAIVALLAVADARSFHELFVERLLYDPVSAPLLTIRGLVPER
jgi:hypothetical protein